MENMYGTELLKRSNRGIELTEAGKILYADGQKKLALSRETEAKIKNAGHFCPARVDTYIIVMPLCSGASRCRRASAGSSPPTCSMSSFSS